MAPSMRLLRGLSAWLDSGGGAADAAVQDERHERRVREIRLAMVESLGRARCEMTQRLAMRIHYAPDLLSLWDLRRDLLRVLSRLHDEQQARQELAPITALFEGLVPGPVWRSGRQLGFTERRARLRLRP